MEQQIALDVTCALQFTGHCVDESRVLELLTHNMLQTADFRRSGQVARHKSSPLQEMLQSASVGPAQQAVKHVAALALLGARNPSLQRAFAAYSKKVHTV